jgi:serine/threonine protein kinase
MMLDERLAPGSLLNNGSYRIVRSVSKGGMGAVYLAEDQRAFDRHCIVKQMLDYYDPADPEDRRRAHERFEEEGRTLASLSHPGIPQIYAFFEESGRYYIVMEYIRGDNLETFVTHTDRSGRVIHGKRLPQEEIVRYTIQTCRVLEYLHSQKRPVVHQDVKPANLILESQLGEVRLVDFGTARAEIPPGAQPGNGSDSSIWGTDGYAPPEQYRRKPVPRSDVFALAATAYHLLTDDDPREHPFKWPQIDRMPREIQVALQRALRNAPEQRSTARELRQALEAMSMPRRTLQTFTFPGGAQIRSVGALPALSDEHWDAARSFLYNGDFQRWLRDLNRHDLVLAADEIIKREENHDAGLEEFLRVVDPGLPSAKVAVDEPEIDLGGVAREAALIRRITAVNVTRGYVLARVSASEPWLEIYPETLHLWAGVPTDIRVNIRADMLPFRSDQEGVVTIQPEGLDPIEVKVSARVSLWRETWRIIWRALSAAFPESWQAMGATWQWLADKTGAIARPLIMRTWLLWVVWFILGVGVGAALYFLPARYPELLPRLGVPWVPPGQWNDYVVPVILGPPFVVSALWLIIVTLALVISGLWGFVRGAWRSFSQ